MRTMPSYERKKRGCSYCKDGESKKYGMVWKVVCPFTACPYHVLDKYNSYEEFMASEDSKILVSEFFLTIESVYELAQHTRPTISSNDDSY